MTPYLVTPPAALPVSLLDMKAHLQVVHDDDDAKIATLQAGHVATLDAYGGGLGRCIMPQTWAVDVTGPGPHLLPFPDATDVTADASGTALANELSRTAMGICITVPEALTDQEITLQATYGLSAERLPAAQALVKIMVSRDYDALHGPNYDAAMRSADALVSALRWRRL